MKRRTLVLVLLNALQIMVVLALFVVRTEAAGAAVSARATWQWPLAGGAVVERPFAPPASAWGAGHRGVDLRATPGQLVLSAGAGTVTYAGLLAGRGVVTVTHDGGLRTTYEPVSPSVRDGARVGPGDVLGSVTSGHDSCDRGATCLHWGLLRGDTYLDPLSLVTQGRLRLLPVSGAAPGLQAATSDRLDPPLPLPEAVTHPRRRAMSLALNQFVNLATVVGLGYGAVVGVRRTRRLVRRLRG